MIDNDQRRGFSTGQNKRFARMPRALYEMPGMAQALCERGTVHGIIGGNGYSKS